MTSPGQMDAKMFIHYSQNPLGMDKAVRERFKIPEGKNFSVVMWSLNNSDSIGRVFVDK